MEPCLDLPCKPKFLAAAEAQPAARLAGTPCTPRLSEDVTEESTMQRPSECIDLTGHSLGNQPASGRAGTCRRAWTGTVLCWILARALAVPSP